MADVKPPVIEEGQAPAKDVPYVHITFGDNMNVGIELHNPPGGYLLILAGAMLQRVANQMLDAQQLAVANLKDAVEGDIKGGKGLLVPDHNPARLIRPD